MTGDKWNQDVGRDKTDETEALPPYAVVDAGPSSQAQQSSVPRDLASSAKGPTIASPFNFPADIPAPAYTQSSTPVQKPIAIPQLSPDATAPFLHAFAPSLLAHGIPDQTWTSFLDTMSAFLAAKVTDRAVSHAADVAKEVGNVPKRFGKNVASHAKSIGRNISDRAKKGNIVGAAFGVIGGAISLPVSTAIGAVGAVVSLPGTAANAVAQNPRTPRERAAVYAAVANKDWFGPRHLHAQLLDTYELARLLGVSSNEILEGALQGKSADAETQLRSLRTHLSDLQLDQHTTLRLGERTLWLVITKDSASW
ncbi:hypothetical protein BKA67DRAFT_542340 [Truncatella angustata]|uniref:Uncharacterized protein n=1 Tax=Truncatella angustata TaxID=152316 RepID=A0A9P8UBQ1_9PEZI|nr:uncharacterized protein BKA67DRAFT_542340 [Truncatella angustata]KAH6643381.1 hypothetical protein BKA67DRAFT_542340 [Truncatella angustata]